MLPLLRLGERRSIVRLELGSPVQCTDGPFGEVADVVVDPTKRRVTHLVVEPHHRHGLARLVPIEFASVQEGPPPAVSLRCTVEEVRRLEPVQEFAYLRLGEVPDDDPGWDIGVESVLAQPYYGYGYGHATAPVELDPHVSMTYDRIPKGEVEIRRASEVTSSDGQHVGHVDGLLVDSEDAITHLVLERGHLWGKREVTIPMGAVARVHTDAVTLTLTKDEVGALPSVPVHRWLG
jgi:sporulation protein YlmC with PRC-barrel domain